MKAKTIAWLSSTSNLSPEQILNDSGDELASQVMLTKLDMAKHGYTRIGTATIEFDLISNKEMIQNKVVALQERNSWFGQDEEMTASALGLHEKLKRTGFEIGSDEYYATLDKTMRKRFPEQFGEADKEEVVPKADQRPKQRTVVAPAVRSTSSNKVKLSPSAVSLAKKLGLTPEQYAIEMKKLEAQKRNRQ